MCRVGDDYYLVNSSFEFFPGLPLWHSRDLVTWTQVGHAITRTSQFAAGAFRPSMGIYAPTLRHRDGTFYLITTAVEGGDGHMLLKAPDISGPWSDPIPVRGLEGFDPDLAWDDDGTCLVTYCANDMVKPLGIHQAAIDLSTGEVLETPRLIWAGTGLQWPEGPHLYKRGDWWHLVIAEGGTDRGHVVCVARSRSARGPFEGAPHNPIFTRRSTSHPVESTGHADLVERPDGTWAAVYLAVRSHGWVPRQHVNGRETFLAGIDWVDDWPVFVDDAFDIPDPDHDFDDDFPADAPLASRWISPGLPVEDFATALPAGGLEVRPASAPAGTMSGLFARARDRHWEAKVELEPRDSSVDVVLRMDERHWFAMRIADGEAASAVRIGDTRSLSKAVAWSGDTVTIAIRSVPPTTRGPDDVELSVVTADGESLLERLDGRYLSMEVAGGFTGRVIGVVAHDGAPVVRRFTYRSKEY